MNNFDISCPPVSELSVSSPYDTLSRVEDNGFLRIEGLGEALAYVQREEEPDECGLLRGAVSKWTTVDPARSSLPWKELMHPARVDEQDILAAARSKDGWERIQVCSL
jgi:hypothetical protein